MNQNDVPSARISDDCIVKYSEDLSVNNRMFCPLCKIKFTTDLQKKRHICPYTYSTLDTIESMAPDAVNKTNKIPK